MKLQGFSFAVMLVAAMPAVAADVSGASSATFVNPVPSTAVTTGVGTSNFTFGDGTTPNRLTFTGASFSSAFETPFKVGSLYYFNGTTTVGTTVDTIDLSLKLTFTTPALPAVTSNFTFNAVSTPNTSDPDASADYIYFPTGYSTTTFNIGGTTYNVKLTGFGNVVGDGFLASNSSQLHVREGSSATADLFAVVTTQTAVVPEPATWALFLGGFGMVGGALRHRRRESLRLA